MPENMLTTLTWNIYLIIILVEIIPNFERKNLNWGGTQIQIIYNPLHPKRPQSCTTGRDSWDLQVQPLHCCLPYHGKFQVCAKVIKRIYKNLFMQYIVSHSASVPPSFSSDQFIVILISSLSSLSFLPPQEFVLNFLFGKYFEYTCMLQKWKQ